MEHAPTKILVDAFPCVPEATDLLTTLACLQETCQYLHRHDRPLHWDPIRILILSQDKDFLGYQARYLPQTIAAYQGQLQTSQACIHYEFTPRGIQLKLLDEQRHTVGLHSSN